MLEPHAVVPMQTMTHGLTGLDPNLCSLYLSIQKVQSRACAFVAMSVRDMLIELQTTSIEIASQLAASHALLMKMQKDLQELKDALDPPPVVSKRDPPEAAETEDEREHKRLKAVYQRRGGTTTLPSGSPCWELPAIPADDAVTLEVTVQEEVAEAMEPTLAT